MKIRDREFLLMEIKANSLVNIYSKIESVQEKNS